MTKQNNIIQIEGGTHAEIKKTLRQCIDLYSDSFESDFEFKLYKNGRAKHIIQVDERVDNERFNYFVNYLNYPEYVGYKVKTEGFTRINDPKLFSKEKLNQDVLIFIPETDKEHDNVYWVTADNEVFKTDFSGKTSKANIRKEYYRPEITFSDFALPEILNVVKETRKSDEITGTDINRFKKRFKVISFIIVALFTLNTLTINTSEVFLKINDIISFLVFIWLIWDYKILRLNFLYLGSLSISFLILIYGYYLGEHFHNSFIKGEATIPIFFLVIQRPIRLLFIAILKREPVIEKPAPTFADFLYTIVLMLTSIMIPLIYFKNYAQ